MGHAPENTMASFKKALSFGADAVECDVHLSRDGRLVVMHDETLDRTTDGSGFIKDHPWAAIRRLDAGSWYGKRFRGQRPLVLEELLTWARRTRLKVVVEIKNDKIRYPGIERAVVQALRKSGMSARAIVISFNHGTIKEIKRLDPSLSAGILFARRLPDPAAKLKWSRADALFPRAALATSALMQKARRAGATVGVWTADVPAEMKRLIRLGVDAIATNHPDRLVRLLSR
jgi:glycerophosphoryl diester phosphodiesterase